MRFSRSFFEHCVRGKNHVTGQVGTPIDFVAFHAALFSLLGGVYAMVSTALDLANLLATLDVVGEANDVDDAERA